MDPDYDPGANDPEFVTPLVECYYELVEQSKRDLRKWTKRAKRVQAVPGGSSDGDAQKSLDDVMSLLEPFHALMKAYDEGAFDDRTTGWTELLAYAARVGPAYTRIVERSRLKSHVHD